MPTALASTKDLPLPVRIFRAAMEQQRSLADYAHSLDISADSLRAIITAQFDHVEPGTLDRLADIYQQSSETLRGQLSITPLPESFAAWLKRNMEGISQHALRTRVQLDSKTLKQFLNGELLPDSDQSERLARALYIDRTELARVVTATMIHQANGEHLVDTTDTSADQLMPSLAITEEPETIRSRRTRRQKATSQTEQTATEGAAANGSTKTADTVREPRTELEADLARRPAAPRQAGTKTAAPRSRATTMPPINPVPVPEIEHARQPAADRQAGTTTAAASDIMTTSPDGAMLHRDDPTVAATGGDILPAFKAPTQRSTRKQRRSGTGAKPSAADAASPIILPHEGEAPVSQDVVERDPRADTTPIATTVPAVVAPPTELAMETDGTVPSDRNGSALSTSEATVASSTAAIPAANTPRAAPSTASATAALAPPPAMIPSVVAADTTTLQLTADEVRLIRHWRQLHPHGRRATLHYIGSLLVDD